MNKLDKAKAKIAALIARSKDAASSEAEVEKALKVALKLAAEYSLSLEDIADHKVKKSDFVKKTVDQDALDVHPVDWGCANAIGRFCDVKAWADRVDGGMVFYGYSVDVELAIYIRDLLIRTSEYEIEKYMSTVKASIRQAVGSDVIRSSFLYGFCERVVERMDRLKGLSADFSDKSTALVVCKMALVEIGFANDLNMAFQTGEKDGVAYENPAEAGRKAGDKVKFNRAVNETDVKSIEGT